MGRIWAIAINTFREAVRDKILNGVLFFAVLVLLFTLALAELSLHQQMRVVLDIGLASISLFSVVMAVFLGSSLLYKEIERKTLYVILPKPIRRWEFLFGKYLGIVVTAAVFIAIMGAVQLWVASFQAASSWLTASLVPVGALVSGAMVWRSRDRASMLVPASAILLALGVIVAILAGVDVAPVVAALALIVGEVIVLSSVALLFGSFSTPFWTGAFTVGVWLAGRSADEMADTHSTALPDSVISILRVTARVCPNFHLFVPGRHLLSGSAELETSVGTYIATTMGYGVAYAAVLLIVAALIFRRRDFL